MVAYNFQTQFANAVASGSKRQTIRPKGKRKHALPGDKLQLYTGMRTKKCRKLREAVCHDACAIRIEDGAIWTFAPQELHTDLDAWANADGFPNWPSMRDFFAKTYGLPFSGVLIRWLVPLSERYSQIEERALARDEGEAGNAEASLTHNNNEANK